MDQPSVWDRLVRALTLIRYSETTNLYVQLLFRTLPSRLRAAEPHTVPARWFTLPRHRRRNGDRAGDVPAVGAWAARTHSH